MQLSGELSKVSFANLLQLVRSGGLTGRINLSQGARVAVIFIETGQPVHVEMEGTTGRDALYELFLWQSGSFAFTEAAIAGSPRTISFAPPDESFDKLIKEGMSYADDKYYLDSLGVTPSTVLRSLGSTGNYAAALMVNPGLERLDGVRTLADALAGLNWSRRDFVHTVAAWLAEGLAELAVPVNVSRDNQVTLPDWVVARLKQDNADLSRAIVDMVIWVDRVKCWMYQADADMGKIMETIQTSSKTLAGGMGEAVAPPGADFEL